MKYIINKRTKEHRVYTDEYFEDADVWDIVEADEEGWIKNPGHGCPVPDGMEIFTRYLDGGWSEVKRPERMRWNLSGSGGHITAYRPILSDTARRPGRTIAFIPPTEHNVFTRLHEATAAVESIPGIIKEIDELLAPAGYCVARRETEQTARNMGDWRSWKAGDLVICVNGSSSLVPGNKYIIKRLLSDGVVIEKDEYGEATAWRPEFFAYAHIQERTQCTI